MAATVDILYVRQLIADPDGEQFADHQIGDTLDREGHVKLAAATLLDAIAADAALTLQRIRTLDLQTDGPAVAKELRATAESLRAQVVQESEADFDVVWP